MTTTKPAGARLSVSRVPYAIGDAVKKPVEAVRSAVADTAAMLGRSGALRCGQGVIATVIALTLGVLCLLAVLAFHFPEYLTTPELRHKYSVDTLRWLLFGGLIVAGGLSLANLIIGNRRNLNVVAFLFVIVAVA